MSALTRSDVRLGHAQLRGRSFLLGNKRAFSLSLPAAAGSSDVLLHPHKWFGAYLYGRKFLEGQVVRVQGRDERALSGRLQTGFTMGLTTARREYEFEGYPCYEEFFVPDGVQGLTCTLDGDFDFSVDPEFDLRFYRALNQSTRGYEYEPIDDGALVSVALPNGRYDDRTEAFVEEEGDYEEARLYAAVQVVGDQAWSESLPERERVRRKVFGKDYRRGTMVRQASADADHAPLWNEYSSRVFAPVRLHLHGHGTIVYGFGSSREEALDQLHALRDSLLGFRAQKTESARQILDHAPLQTGMDRIDTAYAQVLTRLMDTLVARNAAAQDTALDRPVTMILAGNQYFHDTWKRDENIALGFLLALGFYDLARDVIRDTWQLQDDLTGRLPQRIRAGESPPYHSSDGTLWALLRLYQYWRCSGDDALLYEKLPMVELFFRRSLERIVGGMLPSGRTVEAEYLWETWMDTPHTPRHGFPIEIQMLWIAALQNFRPTFASMDPALEARMAEAETAAWQALQRFNVRGIPADSLDEDGEVRDLITPNAYFCFGLGLDLGLEIERTMREIGRHELAGRQGIVTLAPQDWGRVFSAEFLGDRRNVRGRRMRSIGKFNYHRGVEWNWLARFFVEAELKYGEPDRAFRTYLRSQVSAVLDRGGIGGISELYDLSGTRGPDFQAWSMSSFLEAMHAFAGVRVDVPDRRIVVEPQIPTGWPYLAVRKWYGATPLDVRFEPHFNGQTLHLRFPWGEAPDAELEISLPLHAGESVQNIDLRLDGALHGPVYRVEPILGAKRSRVLIRVPAGVDVQIALVTRGRAARIPASA